MKSALTLAIETSNPSAGGGGGVALVGPGGQAIGVEPVGQEPQHDDLMSGIERLCTRCGKKPGDLTRVAVSLGPGGYTAVRLAVTAAKMIAEATGAELVGVPTALVVARRVQWDGPFGVALASKGETTFVTRFEDGRMGDGALMDAAGLEPLRIGLLVGDRFLPEAIRRRAEELGITVRPPVFDPVACAEAAEAIAPADPAALMPIYPREPEAVRKWRELRGE